MLNTHRKGRGKDFEQDNTSAQCVGSRPDALFRRTGTLSAFADRAYTYATNPPGTGPSGACASIRV
jgi:hypothetical protein